MSLNGDSDALRAYYADWASTYDGDVGDAEYGLPRSVLVTLDAAIEHEPWLAERDIAVLDAGCGTGRVGMVLHDRGYSNIHGVDLSPEMVELARQRDIYQSLEAPVDLTATPAPHWRHRSDLVVVGGVFTVGHIPPEALATVAQLVRPGGVLITTVRPGYFDTTDYGRISAQMTAGPAADLLVEFDDLPYTADTHGRYYAYRIASALG